MQGDRPSDLFSVAYGGNFPVIIFALAIWLVDFFTFVIVAFCKVSLSYDDGGLNKTKLSWYLGSLLLSYSVAKTRCFLNW